MRNSPIETVWRVEYALVKTEEVSWLGWDGLVVERVGYEGCAGGTWSWVVRSIDATQKYLQIKVFRIH